MEWDLPLLLGLAVAFGVAMYVLPDGFDLGVGILFPFAPGEPERSTMMNSIAPVWDGNETCLVFGGTLLIAAFPLAYATLLPAFYVPLLIDAVRLIFRGVAFEFRFTAPVPGWCGIGVLRRLDGRGIGAGHRARRALSRASTYRTEVAGGPFTVADPVSLMVGVSGWSVGYALLGATWLVMKTEGLCRSAR